MRFSVKSKFLMSAAMIAFCAAVWHLLCILGGPSWFAFARAPQLIIDSAQQGTLLAPIGTVIVATLMFACTLFAFSAVGLIRKLPFLRSALIVISGLCLVRGLIAIPLLITPVGIDMWEVIASSVWFYVGVCYLVGSVEQFRHNKVISH